MEGCILIGDLPIPWYETDFGDPPEHEEFPIDLFYMDMDGVFADDDEDGSGGAYPDWEPHLHFGLRRGSPVDYPGSGDDRWMAGYTSAHPTELGWLEPSAYIERH